MWNSNRPPPLVLSLEELDMPERGHKNWISSMRFSCRVGSDLGWGLGVAAFLAV